MGVTKKAQPFKVGCTNWKRTMLQLIHPETYGKMKVENIKSPHGKKGDKGYRYLHTWEPEEQIKMLKTYYKFMFARHPFERLLSAYRDKVQKYYLDSHFLKRHMSKMGNEGRKKLRYDYDNNFITILSDFDERFNLKLFNSYAVEQDSFVYTAY